MADVKIIDIGGEQWNIKDYYARDEITVLKENVNNIQTLLSNTDIFKLNIRTRKITVQKILHDEWSMGHESSPDGYEKIFMLPFIQCPRWLPVIATNALNQGDFDVVYLYNPTGQEGEVVINLISIFKKR